MANEIKCELVTCDGCREEYESLKEVESQGEWFCQTCWDEWEGEKLEEFLYGFR